jgi:hypothetical protein
MSNKEIIALAKGIDLEYKSNDPRFKSVDDVIGHLSILESNIKQERLKKGINRRFKETFGVDNIEVLTHNGFVKIKEIGKTEPYLKYKIKTTNHELECADDHLLVDSEYDLIFAKDLNKDSRPDKIITENGPETVLDVINTGEYEEMYDISIEQGSDQLYYSNGILSHNSIYLANDAANFVKMGTNTVVITAEMAAHKFVKRIGSNLLSINIAEYAEKSKNRDLMKRKLETVGDGFTPPGQLFVKQMPTSQATVLDIEAYVSQIEEEKQIKIGAVVIDYINILANYRNLNTENTYMKIKQIAEDLRAMGQRNDWLIVTATQITRSGYNSSDITMTDIAESAGLSHTADIMYGIIQDDLMRANEEYWLKILKIRDGEGKGTKCKLNINWKYMRLIETEDMSTSNIHGI